MIAKSEYLTNIADSLGVLSKQVELRNSISLFDINIAAEDFYPGLLNLIYKTDLKNVNTVEKNASAIDLVDDHKKISIQVTSDESSNKIRHTISEFNKNEWYKKYNRLVILILTKKPHYTTSFDTEGKFSFDKEKDIIDVSDLLKAIKLLSTSDVKKINDYLSTELISKREKTCNTESNEVDSIMDLIEFISHNRGSYAPKDVVVDPNYKINIRFKEYANTLISLYTELMPVYGEALREVEAQKNDQIQKTITTIFLQDISERFLDENDNQPIKALNQLVDYFYQKLSSNGKEYDFMAIKFFMIAKTIECSVFPNERSEYYAG